MVSFALNAARAARSGALAVADALAVNKAVAATAWRKRRLLILCYHGVSLADEHEWSDLYVSPGHLERRLSMLKRAGSTILPLQEAVERLQRNDLPPLSVSITFDDGAYDFSAKAAPLLAAADAHATLYLTTYYCGRPQPVFDTVTSYLLWKARGRSVRVPGIDRTVTIPHRTSDPGFADLHHSLRRHALQAGMTADAKHELARLLATTVGQDFDALVEQRLFQIMTHDEVRALDARHVDVQLHTHRHRTPRDRDAFLNELRENADIIHALRGRAQPLTHFCYPSGDYVREYAEWLREAGVQWATTCDPGLASRQSDRYFLPRFVDTEPVPESTFLAWVSGLSMVAFARRTTTPVRLQP